MGKPTNRVRPWHEDDAFWEVFDPFLFNEAIWIGAGREVEHLLRLADLAPGEPVLDLCCGPGRHLLELARRGYRVTGVDRTERYLARARAAAAREKLQVRLVRQDMRSFVEPGAYALAINLYTSFGYFENPEDDWRVLRNLHDSLAARGVLVMELMSREVLARIFVERDWRELADRSLVMEERRIQDDWSRVEARWIHVSRDGQRSEHTVTHRLYAASDLRALLLEVGFTAVRIYGSLAGEPYDHQAHRLVAVARR
jgi:SAM-dependent methyltransferase